MTQFTAQEKRAIREEFNVDCDWKVAIFHRDGTLTMRRHFFYRHGKTLETVAARFIERVAEATGVTIVARMDDERTKEVWRTWPQDSYWAVNFQKPAIEQAIAEALEKGADYYVDCLNGRYAKAWAEFQMDGDEPYDVRWVFHLEGGTEGLGRDWHEEFEDVAECVRGMADFANLNDWDQVEA